MNTLNYLYLPLIVIGLLSGRCLPNEWRGNVASELRYFLHDIENTEQSTVAISAAPEWYHDFADGNNRLVMSSFARLDSRDDERNHIDLRELYWLHIAENWEVKVGLIKTFWGVTESQHLVDVINQTDNFEGVDGEDKLGQPAVQLNLLRDWGTLEFYWLPYFRERDYYDTGSRLAISPAVKQNEARFESSAENTHQDVALHYLHNIGSFDFGLGYFNGTARDPIFLPELSTDNSTAQNSVELIPYYSQLQQYSLEGQATLGAWLWKIEAVSRKQLGEHYSAAVFGFEYTLYGIADSSVDIGLISEYHFDDRKDQSPNPLNHDLMLGTRIALNDVDSSEMLIGMVIDEQSEAKLFSIEASRRLGQRWKVEVEGRWFSDQPNDDPLYQMRNNDFIEIGMSYYF